MDAHIATATLDHTFESGVQMRNQLRFADYNRYYANTLPGAPVNAAGTQVPITGYRNETDRTNYFSQNDFTYKFLTGDVKHTLLAGFELGYQEGLAFRQTAFFNTGSSLVTSVVVNPMAPNTRAPVTFRNNGTTDANFRYDLGLAAAYAQDQIDLNEYVQIVGGLRYDYFDFSSRGPRHGSHQRAGGQPRLAPRRTGDQAARNLAFYGSYSVSYLPSSATRSACSRRGSPSPGRRASRTSRWA